MGNLKIISLGAGVQSSTMFLMSCLGEIERADYAIFADTGAEPKAVYDHLVYLQGLGSYYGIPVEVVQFGNLEEQLLNGDAFGSVPFFTVNKDGSNGMGSRQCTAQFKIRPLYKRSRELMQKRGEKELEMWIGISTDEIQRMKDARPKYVKNRWPLIEKRMSRTDCLAWYSAHDFRTPPRSACVFCPFMNDREWLNLRENDKCGWNRAVNVDRKIREVQSDHIEYVHAQRVPLADVEFSEDNPDQLDLFGNECEGMCGI